LTSANFLSGEASASPISLRSPENTSAQTALALIHGGQRKK